MSFVHLHSHSEYSLLDGSLRINPLKAKDQNIGESFLKKAKDLGMNAVALTDHGVMYGAIEFISSAKNYGIKPIVGCEVYVAKRTRFDKSPKLDDDQYHLLLLAKDYTGYQNLLKLVTYSNLEGFYYKPRVDHELLSKYSKGIIASSACLSGEIPSFLLEGNEKKAKETACLYKDIFGSENFYLELQDNSLKEQKEVNPKIVKLSEDVQIPLVASNDVHYLTQRDAEYQDVLLCIQTQKTVYAEKRLRFGSDQFYLKSPQEMELLFGQLPSALKNTLNIAEKCSLKLDFSKHYLPDFEQPPGFTRESYLEMLCDEGLAKRFKEHREEIKDRLNYELTIIKSTGLAAYFLIVWDFVNFAKTRGIPVGPGRGSSVGSLVAYLLGITEINPLEHGLIFERFLNPDRISLPDIDIDFCVERREEVINYVAEKYGKDKVAQIVTFGRMKARASIRDTGRALDVPLSYVDKIAKLVPFGYSISEALETQELKTIYEKDKKTKNLLDTAANLEGLARNVSIHAAGVVISKDSLTSHVPLQRMSGNEIVVQYEMNSLEKIGLLKMDFLGLRNLTVMDECLKLIKKTHKKEINLLDLSFDDKKTYKLLSEGKTSGVFQLESSGMKRYIRELKPKKIEDIIAILALYRPGALSAGAVDEFVKIKNGKGKVKYLHPSLEEVLKETCGVIVYQEQVMQIANLLAGYSMAQADELRKAMGKKKPELMAKLKQTFLEGCKNKGINNKTASKIFELMEYFSGYGFNKPHSTAYAFISYQTAYLKANYPKEYMASLLTSVMGNTDKVTLFVRETNCLGIKVFPPDINISEVGFSSCKDGIWWGLASIKNVGYPAAESIIKARTDSGRFDTLFDLAARVDLRLVNKRVLESLVKSGAMDKFGANRATLLASVDKALEYGTKFQKEKKSGQMSLFDHCQGSISFDMKSCYVKGDDLSSAELLKCEKEVLGIYITSHPLDEYKTELEKIANCTVENLSDRKKSEQVSIAGLITNCKKIITRSNQAMAFLTLEDFTGTVEVIVLPKVYETAMGLLKEDELVVVRGSIDFKDKFSLNSEEAEFIEVKVLANDIKLLKDYFKYARFSDLSYNKDKDLKGYHIRIHPYQQVFLKDLKEIIKRNKGRDEVYLHLEGGAKDKTLIKLGEEYKVAGEGFLKETEELLGKGLVWEAL